MPGTYLFCLILAKILWGGYCFNSTLQMGRVRLESLRLHSNLKAELRLQPRSFWFQSWNFAPLHYLWFYLTFRWEILQRKKQIFLVTGIKWVTEPEIGGDNVFYPLILSGFFTYLPVTICYLRNYDQKALWAELYYDWQNNESPL